MLSTSEWISAWASPSVGPVSPADPCVVREVVHGEARVLTWTARSVGHRGRRIEGGRELGIFDVLDPLQVHAEGEHCATRWNGAPAGRPCETRVEVRQLQGLVVLAVEVDSASSVLSGSDQVQVAGARDRGVPDHGGSLEDLVSGPGVIDGGRALAPVDGPEPRRVTAPRPRRGATVPMSAVPIWRRRTSRLSPCWGAGNRGRLRGVRVEHVLQSLFQVIHASSPRRIWVRRVSIARNTSERAAVTEHPIACATCCSGRSS